MYVIDLHGYKHKDALIKVEEYLLLNSVTKIIDVKIVTGNSPTLQNKLIKMFDNYNFSYYIPPHNTGEMIVSDNEIL
ncbi:MAG: hypothetical protein CMC40_02270 [Flavobacteriaceae bacterium]|nr:hypothetical protein [Flavobacteriaceae bacterium]|tara:strand:- start:3314 stop:3544 length:231 start_codon:yes stop_codon:yes gene_type:complete